MKRNAGKVLMWLGAVLLIVGAALAAAVWYMDSTAGHPSADPEGNVEPGVENPVDWDYWLSVNPDIVGWVRVPGTAIDQPVVQAPEDDPQKYLTHDVYGNWNLWGVPYVDAACARGADSWNVVVFGHNMSYPPAMFHDFQFYADEGFARDHAEIEFYTPQEARYLQVLGSDTINGWEDVKRTDFADAADFTGYRQERMDARDVKLAEPTGFGQLYTFCTCSYYFNPSDERTLVYAEEHDRAPQAASA